MSINKNTEVYGGIVQEEQSQNLLPQFGTISRQVTKNIAHKEEYIQLDLFAPEKVEEMRLREGEGYVNTEHRPIELSLFQKKLVIWLSDYISRQRDSSDIQTKISALNTWVEYEPKFLLLQALKTELKSLPTLKDITDEEKSDRKRDLAKRIGEAKIGLPESKELSDTFNIANNDIKRYVSYEWLSKMIFSGSTRSKNLTEVREGIEGLAQVYCPIVYEGKIGRYEPLISLSSMTPSVMMEDEDEVSKKGRKRAKEVSLGRWINFSSSFFYKANMEFAIITPKLAEILQKNNTEVFMTLLFDLCAKTYQYKGRAKIAEAKIKKELSRKAYNGKTEDERLEIIRKEIDKASTYEVFDDTLQSMMKGDYRSDRRYRSRYEELIDRAVRDLKDYGIIKSGKRSLNRDKARGYKRYFTFNQDFGKQIYEEAQDMGRCDGGEDYPTGQIKLLPERQEE